MCFWEFWQQSAFSRIYRELYEVKVSLCAPSFLTHTLDAILSISGNFYDFWSRAKTSDFSTFSLWNLPIPFKSILLFLIGKGQHSNLLEKQCNRQSINNTSNLFWSEVILNMDTQASRREKMGYWEGIWCCRRPGISSCLLWGPSRTWLPTPRS